jgi:CO/xanthine dehydrogenase FAD-binding subunit
MGLKLETFSTSDAAEQALAADAAARYLGGGTLLVRSANEGDISFSAYVRSTEPGLRDIAVTDGEVRLGAGVTMAEILRHPALGFLAPAARAVGGPAIRNMATVGGNLFARVPYGDFGVALMALDATLEIGSGSVAVADFFAQRETAHGRAIVRAIRFAVPAEGAFRFLKVSRVKPKGASVLSLAAVITETSGVISRASVAYGCMADRPITARAVGTALIGRPRTKEGIAEALAAARDGTDPLSDAIASAWYRAEVLPVHLGRLLLGT